MNESGTITSLRASKETHQSHARIVSDIFPGFVDFFFKARYSKVFSS
jgi:hypothetical protein